MTIRCHCISVCFILITIFHNGYSITVGLTNSDDYDYLNNLTTAEKTAILGDASTSILFKLYKPPDIYNFNDYKNSNTALENAKLDVIIGGEDDALLTLANSQRIPYYLNNVALTSATLSATYGIDKTTALLADVTNMKLVTAAMDIVQMIAKRKKVVIITDAGIDKTGFLLTLVTDLQLYYIKISPTSTAIDTRNALLPIKQVADPDNSAYIIVISSSNHQLAEIILEGAGYLSMLKNTSFWIVSSLFIENSYLLPFYATGANIYTFGAKNTALKSRTEYNHGILIDCINHFIKAINYSTTVNKTTVMDQVLSTEYISNNGIFAFDRTIRQSKYTELEIMKTDNKQKNTLVKSATWFSYKPKKIETNETSITVPMLDLVAVIDNPFVTNSSNSANQFTGFTISLLDEVRKTVKFDYNITLAEDGKYGSYDETTKSWNGIVKVLVENRAHMSLNLLAETNQRRKEKNVIIGEKSILTAGRVMLMHKALKENDLLRPLYPLSWNVWLAILVAFIILSATLYTTDKISPNEIGKSMFDPADALFFVYSSFVMSKLPRNPIKPSARIFILILWFASLMYVFTYATNFFFMIILRDESLEFHSISGLGNHSKNYYWTMISAGATQVFFLNDTGDYNKMYQQGKTEWPDKYLVNSNQEAINMILSTKIGEKKPVFIGDETVVSFIANNNCDLKMVGAEHSVDRKGQYFFYSKKMDKKLMKAINTKLWQLYDDGTVSRLEERYWAGKQCSSAENIIDQKDLTAVQITEVGGIFIVLAVGCALALIIAIVELIIRKMTLSCQRWKKNPHLYFRQHYNAKIMKIEKNGMWINIDGIKGKSAYIYNYQLHPMHDRTFDARNLEMNVGDEITVEFLGNCPETGNRLFQKVN